VYRCCRCIRVGAVTGVTGTMETGSIEHCEGGGPSVLETLDKPRGTNGDGTLAQLHIPEHWTHIIVFRRVERWLRCGGRGWLGGGLVRGGWRGSRALLAGSVDGLAVGVVAVGEAVLVVVQAVVALGLHAIWIVGMQAVATILARQHHAQAP
jgi:hypothetical protein